ncbi:MAG: outer membrane protein transport protein [Dysgonamonadaceae bacterium]|jgi:long-subunit fatty acid transport protein|nr:outer membrane protein transport protein [Dysgonamonadaceae bacterium]
MKRSLLIFITAFSISALSYGQGEMDAHRNSKTELSGSARGLGMAGAFGALGGDITGVTANPAGIAVYRSSELLTTMNFSSANIKTNWKGTGESDSKFKFNVDNIAYMGYFPLGDDVVSGVNFGFAYNKLKDFDRNYKSHGFGMKTSLSDFIATDATLGGYSVDGLKYLKDSYDPYRKSNAPWIDVLGFNGKLIQEENGKYVSYLLDNETIDHEMDVTERGHIETYDFTAGTSFSEKLYLGITFSLTDLHYSISSRYSEFYGTTTDGFDLTNGMTEDGAGYQVSVGAIFKPIDELRIGLAYHSPTWYDMDRSFWGKTHAVYEADKIDEEFSAPRNDPYAVTDYRLQTPQRLTAGIAGIIASRAILSLDYELTDYTAMDMAESDGYSDVFDKQENSYINQDFRKASTVKIGAEFRVTPQFSVRAGYAWMQNPYTTSVREGNVGVMLPYTGTIPHYTIEGDVDYITCGLGYRFTRSFYIDAAFVYRTQTDDLYYFPKYLEKGQLLVDSTPAKFENKMYKGVLTLGYKF